MNGVLYFWIINDGNDGKGRSALSFWSISGHMSVLLVPLSQSLYSCTSCLNDANHFCLCYLCLLFDCLVSISASTFE